MLQPVDWDFVTKPQNGNAAYNRVLEIFCGFYDLGFPKQKIKIKKKNT